MCRLVQVRHIRVDGDEYTENDYELCEKAAIDGGVRCSSSGTTTSHNSSREVKPVSPRFVRSRPKSTVIYQEERPKPGSRDAITGVNMHIGWTPSFSLIKEKKIIKEKKRRPTYPPDGSMGLPAYLPSQQPRPSAQETPLHAPDAPSPGFSIRRPTSLGTARVASSASLSTPGYPSTVGDSGHETSTERYAPTRVVLSNIVAPTASSSNSKAPVRAVNSPLPPLDTNVGNGIPLRPASLRQSAVNPHLTVPFPTQSYGTTATHSSRMVNPGLRDNRASKDTNRSSFRDSALGTSVASPSSPSRPSSLSVPTTLDGRRPNGPRRDGPGSSGVDYMIVRSGNRANDDDDLASQRETKRTERNRADALSILEGNSSSSRSRPYAILYSDPTTTRRGAMSQGSTTAQPGASFNRDYQYYVDGTTSEGSRHASGNDRHEEANGSLPPSISSPSPSPSAPSPRRGPLKPILRRSPYDNEATSTMDDKTRKANQTIRADVERRVAIEQAEQIRAAAEDARLRDLGFGYR